VARTLERRVVRTGCALGVVLASIFLIRRKVPVDITWLACEGPSRGRSATEGRSPTPPDRLGCCVVARSFASRIRPETIARGLGKGGLNVKAKLKERGGVGRTALEAGVPKMNTDGVGSTVCAPDGVGGTVCSPILLEEKYLFVPRAIADGWLASGGDHVGLHRRGWKRETIGRARQMLLE